MSTEEIWLAQGAIIEGTHGIDRIPGLIARIIERESWKHFTAKGSGEVVTFDSFADFVTAPLPKGLSTTIERLKDYCHHDKGVLDLIEAAAQPKIGRPPKGSRNNITSFQRGTSEPYALRRLRNARPDLHQRVIDGTLSAHAAMLEAGFRHPTATVQLDDPQRIANTLVKRLDPDDVRAVAKYLLEAIDK